ncbi:MAG TPA: hypothetical protein PLM96_04485 [Methanoregulaceae archaeon]|nr:hypothetical protein [Methanolinea sp.]MCC7567751.1 hypothetical protein [Methanoregulaceae archaeon]MDD3091370.1 hypothetical protein [Methanoregulaceae archaeon]MDD5049023.1 hypothetical protein [Methanoregulaceae archaeon]MDD5685333.1 hypothetical protein [Methanoregulaceae archaeon]
MRKMYEIPTTMIKSTTPAPITVFPSSSMNHPIPVRVNNGSLSCIGGKPSRIDFNPTRKKENSCYPGLPQSFSGESINPGIFFHDVRTTTIFISYTPESNRYLFSDKVAQTDRGSRESTGYQSYEGERLDQDPVGFFQI